MTEIDKQYAFEGTGGAASLPGLFADNRGELVPAGWVAQGYGETVGAVEGVTQPGALQSGPRAPLCEQRVDALKVGEQGAARMGDPRRAARGQRLGRGRDPGLLMMTGVHGAPSLGSGRHPPAMLLWSQRRTPRAAGWHRTRRRGRLDAGDRSWCSWPLMPS